MGVYLDHASSTPPLQPVREALAEGLEAFGDPLRLHADGRRARDLLEAARRDVAEAIGAQADEIVFTSGGTESVSLALTGLAHVGAGSGRIVLGGVEHPCVVGAATMLAEAGFELSVVEVDATGRLDLDRFLAEVRRPGTILASVQHSNHEVGTLQPIAEAARFCREAGVRFHSDACQSAGRLPLDVAALDVDALSLSAHKFGGPVGSGALYVRRGVQLGPALRGDDRERHRRAGAENLPGIVGMATALRAAVAEIPDQAARQWLITTRVREAADAIDGVRLHGHPTQRAPHIATFTVESVDPEVLLMALDDRGYQVGIGGISSGLAHDPSPVLAAMGTPGLCPVRVSVGPQTTDDDVEGFLAVLPGLIAELQRMESASSDAMAHFNQRSDPDRP